mgnify:FL=1
MDGNVSKVSEGDYVVVMSEGSTPAARKHDIWRVSTVKPDSIVARIEKVPHISPITSEFDHSSVLVNLGSNPPAGVVYGYNMAERYRGAKTVESGIELHAFTKVSRERMDKLRLSFKRIHGRLDKLKLAWLLDENVVYELRGRRGRWAGSFQRSKDVQKRPHRICYYLDVEVTSNDYLILHEMGHLVEATLYEYPKLWAAWQKIYNKTVIPAVVDKKVSNELLESLVALGDEASIREWNSSLEEDAKPSARAVLRWIRQNRRVRPHDLDTLLIACEWDEVRSLWPDDTIETKHEIDPVVSEYATINCSELFAEAWAFKLTGIKLPKKVDALVDKTMSILRDYDRAR